MVSGKEKAPAYLLLAIRPTNLPTYLPIRRLPAYLFLLEECLPALLPDSAQERLRELEASLFEARMRASELQGSGVALDTLRSRVASLELALQQAQEAGVAQRAAQQAGGCELLQLQLQLELSHKVRRMGTGVA